MDNSYNSINKTIADIHYKIVRKLGEGMFSAVKLATHSLTGEQVAIKILEKTKISKIEDKERINREISIMKKLRHFNVVKLYQIIETKLNIYLIQENIEGQEFMNYLTKKGKLKEIDACKFYHQIISGLEYIHHCGVAHRDFKPENILLTNNNTILKIIDFGLSNLYHDKELLSTSCGSPCYAPPEMIKEEKYNGAESDIWSSGIILYLMLCGKLPFYHEQNEIMYEKILSGKFELPNFLSDKAKDILSKILELDPKKRLNFEEIKAHPWFNIIDKNLFIHKGINVNEDIMPIDEEVVQKMDKMGFNKMEIRFNLIKNFHNKITAVYDLLLKKEIENGKKSIADLNSELYDKYINDKMNKISHYGSLEKALKHRICDDKKVLNILPNYYEDKYNDNNENMILGDTGSVIERLIKSGKFTYDEENMCLSKVTNTNKPNVKKRNNDDGECKFRTISEMNQKPQKNLKKTMNENEGKNKNYIENKMKSPKESPKKKAQNKLKKTHHHAQRSEIIKSNKSEICKTENNIDGDWYKEIENMIIGEAKKSKETKRQSQQNIKGLLAMNNNKSNSLTKRKKKEEEIKNVIMFEENKVLLNRSVASNREIKPKINNSKKLLTKSTFGYNKTNNSCDKNTLRKSTLVNHKKSKFLDHNNNPINNNSVDMKRKNTLNPKTKLGSINNNATKSDIMLRTAKTKSIHYKNNLSKSMHFKLNTNRHTMKNQKSNLNNSIKKYKKVEDLSDDEFFSSGKLKKIKNVQTSYKAKKYVRKVKTLAKKKTNEIKEFTIEENRKDDIYSSGYFGRKRGLSCKKRSVKIKI